MLDFLKVCTYVSCLLTHLKFSVMKQNKIPLLLVICESTLIKEKIQAPLVHEHCVSRVFWAEITYLKSGAMLFTKQTAQN